MGTLINRPFALRAPRCRRIALVALCVGLFAAGLSTAASAQDTAAATQLEQRTYEHLGCTLSVPADWVGANEEDRVRFKLDDKGGAGLLRVWRTRKSFVQIKEGLVARAEKEGWTDVAPDDRVIDGRKAFYMTSIAAVRGKDATVTNLFFVVDAPTSTFLLHVGMLTDRYDDETMSAIAESFRLIVAEPVIEPAAEPEPSESAGANDDWGTKGGAADGAGAGTATSTPDGTEPPADPASGGE